jgi:putative Mg2+ transporter-C (MgtC) family protein
MTPMLVLSSLIPSTPLGDAEIALRIIVAVVFGMVIGWERDKADKPADARTMALIAAGAAGFTLLGVQLTASLPEGAAHMNLDPTRVISYIISGVGFLGAGAILHSKRTVTGLTTAASIWTAAAIGAACGIGAFNIATGMFVVAFVVLWGPRIRQRVMNGQNEDDVTEEKSESNRSG